MASITDELGNSVDLDAAVLTVSAQSALSVDLPGGMPAAFIVLVNSRHLLPGLDFTVADGEMTFVNGIYYQSTLHIMDLSDGSRFWSLNLIDGVIA